MSAPPQVLSLGAGVQSTTIALMSAHGEITPMPDLAIFADTGAEPASVYEHLAWLASPNVLPFPIRILRDRNLRDDILRTMGGKSAGGRANGYLAPPFFVSHPTPGKRGGVLRRECTQNYKIRPIERAIKEFLGLDPDRPIQTGGRPLVNSWLGISADEFSRVSPNKPKWVAKRHPLISRLTKCDSANRWMSRRDCLAWLDAHDYPRPPKSACTFCPYRDAPGWRELRDRDPEGFDDAVMIDRSIRNAPMDRRAGLTADGHLYVHPSMVPLDEASLDKDIDDGPNLFNQECAGMCGV